MDGFTPDPTINKGAPSAVSLEFYYTDLVTPPTTAQTFRVRLHKGLQFASGAVLADDVEVSVVPHDVPFGWVVTGSQSQCAVDVMTPACSAQPVGHGRWALLAGLLTSAALVVRRRRRP